MNLPDDSHRITIYGKTGSGKTYAALWHLSHRSYTTKPWIIWDFKGDTSIAQIPYIQEISTKDNPGRLKKGLFVVRPFPDEDVEPFMWKMWDRGNIGSYVDEGYMVGRNNKAFRALLTQGRSKHIPMINLTQRPVDVTRFMISEADFHQVFKLNDERDRETVQQFIPDEHDIVDSELPKFHSWYYDVGSDDFIGLKPVPKLEKILQTFDNRLRTTLRML